MHAAYATPATQSFHPSERRRGIAELVPDLQTFGRGPGGGPYRSCEPRGSDKVDNLQTLCRDCNRGKGGSFTAGGGRHTRIDWPPTNCFERCTLCRGYGAGPARPRSRMADRPVRRTQTVASRTNRKSVSPAISARWHRRSPESDNSTAAESVTTRFPARSPPAIPDSHKRGPLPGATIGRNGRNWPLKERRRTS